MNYAYDIILNLNNKLYDFFDWNDSDHVLHVKKIPLFRVSSKVIMDLTYYKVIVEKTFLQKIYRKTELYTKGYVNFLALFSDGANAIAIKFDKQGMILQRSKFLIDEDIEINNLASHLKLNSLNYQVIKLDGGQNNKTRMQQKCYNFVFNNVRKINNLSEIKYLNYELFSIKSDSKKVLVSNLKKQFDTNYLKIYQFFKLINSVE